MRDDLAAVPMPPDPPTPALSRRAQLRADFLEVDTRWLAVSRVVLGLLVLAYVGSLVSQDRPTAFFSDEGVLPLDVVRRLEPQHHFFTVFHFAHTPVQARALFGIEALLAVAVIVGLGTRVTAPLAWLGLISIHHRIPFVSNASMITMHLLGILWVFLPLSWHASVDAWIARRRGRIRAPYRVTSLAPLVLRLQLFAVYYFNAVHKSGPTWRHGEAVHYVLFTTYSSWPWTVWLRGHEPAWFSPVFTYSAVVLEMTLAVLMVFPAARVRCRRLAVLGMLALHGGISALLDVGPFPFVFGAAALMLACGEDGARLDRLLRVDAPFGSAPDDVATRVRSAARELVLVVHLFCSLCLTWVQNDAMKLVLGPAPLFAKVHRYYGYPLYAVQAWSMFAADAPLTDRLLICAVELDDGRVLDVATRRPPSFEDLATRSVPVDFLAGNFESLIVERRDPEMVEAYARYQANRPRREGWLARARVAAITVHELFQQRPAPGAERAPTMRTRVLYTKRWWPREEPAHFEY